MRVLLAPHARARARADAQLWILCEMKGPRSELWNTLPSRLYFVAAMPVVTTSSVGEVPTSTPMIIRALVWLGTGAQVVPPSVVLVILMLSAPLVNEDPDTDGLVVSTRGSPVCTWMRAGGQTGRVRAAARITSGRVVAEGDTDRDSRELHLLDRPVSRGSGDGSDAGEERRDDHHHVVVRPPRGVPPKGIQTFSDRNRRCMPAHRIPCVHAGRNSDAGLGCSGDESHGANETE